MFFLQSGWDSPESGVHVAEAAHRPEKHAVLAVPDEGRPADPLLEHPHGECLANVASLGCIFRLLI